MLEESYILNPFVNYDLDINLEDEVLPEPDVEELVYQDGKKFFIITFEDKMIILRDDEEKFRSLLAKFIDSIKNAVGEILGDDYSQNECKFKGHNIRKKMNINEEEFEIESSGRELTSAYFSLLLNTRWHLQQLPLTPSFFFPYSVGLHPSLQGHSGETLGSLTFSYECS